MRPRDDSRREFPQGFRRKEPAEDSVGERSSMIEAMHWVHRITAIGAEMAIPTACGWYIDYRFDCRPWGAVIGALLGFWIAGQSLVSLIRAADAESAVGTGPTFETTTASNTKTGMETENVPRTAAEIINSTEAETREFAETVADMAKNEKNGRDSGQNQTA